MRLVPPEQNDKKIMNKGWFVADVATAIRWYHTISATDFSPGYHIRQSVPGAGAAKNGLLDHA